MKLTFKSADEPLNFGFDIYSQTAVTDLTKIEKHLGKDLTDIIQKVIDVAFNVTSQMFTRGPKDAYVVSYSWELYPTYEKDTVKSITVTVSDSDHGTYEFEGVEDRDIDAMITWLRKEHQVYYTPNNELLNEKKKLAEQQKKIDSYESTLSKITNIMEPKYAGPVWSETWDDLVERIKRLKTEHDDARGLSLKIEELEETLKFAKQAENWHIRTNRELVMERDTYRDTCEELKQDINEWQDWFDSICEELDTPARDFATVLNELRKNLNELDKLAEFKAKLAEVIKLPEDMKGPATTEDYISSFEHTKKEWRKMEIKIENYEREIRLLNALLEDRKKKLDDILPDYRNAKCARAELAWVYKNVLDVDRLDPELSPHEIATRIKRSFDIIKDREQKNKMVSDRHAEDAKKYYRRTVELKRDLNGLEQKLNGIKDICEGNSNESRNES